MGCSTSLTMPWAPAAVSVERTRASVIVSGMPSTAIVRAAISVGVGFALPGAPSADEAAPCGPGEGDAAELSGVPVAVPSGAERLVAVGLYEGGRDSSTLMGRLPKMSLSRVRMASWASSRDSMTTKAVP